jgi:hypothetical protein
VRHPFRTVIEFDLGACLELTPYSRTDELWLLYEPGGKVLRVRADRKYAYCDATTRAESWKPIWN